MGSIVAEIADKIASAGGGERSELEVRGGVGADGGGILTLSTSELTVVDGDKLGRIDFSAPIHGTGAGDARLVAASIWAEADASFSDTVNTSDIVFAVGDSEAAVEVMRIDHDGQLGIGTTAPTSTTEIVKNITTASAPETVLTISGVNGSSTDLAAGAGVRLLFKLPEAGANPTTRKIGASIDAVKNAGADANSETNLVFSVYQNDETLDEALRIDSSGNVGIGKTPSSWHTTYNGIELGHSSGGGHCLYNRYLSSTQTMVGLVQNAYPTGSGGYTSILAEGSARMEITSGEIQYYTAPANGAGGALTMTERMRITNAGNFAFHQANASAGCPFTLSGGADNSEHIAFSQGGRTNAIDNYYSSGSTASTMRLRVTNGSTDGTSTWGLKVFASGVVYSRGSFSASQSDKRLKTDVTNITSPLSKISAINGVDFKWIDNLEDIKPNSGLAGKTDVGVIAQEIEAVLPHAVSLAPFDSGNPNKDGSIPEDAVTYKGEVSESGENYLTVDYTKIIPLLIEGIKELSAKVTALENA